MVPALASYPGSSETDWRKHESQELSSFDRDPSAARTRGENIQALDPFDTVAITEGPSTPGQVRPMNELIDEPDTSSVPDKDRAVLLKDRHTADLHPEPDPHIAINLHYDDLDLLDPFASFEQ